MECNRDEAVRAKEIAEKKFRAKDIKGAKKLALKAQNLYPELEGISQMLRTLEVYISAEEEMTQGEYNWYGVLGVTRLADDETIRKQYRKLALLLHPDKNRSVGAEGAFQLVSQAWSLLSDKSKRIAYDQKCGGVSKQKNNNKNVGPSKPPAQNGFCHVAKATTSQARVPKAKSSRKDASSGPYPSCQKESHTFWTVCHRCKMQYEYLRMYLNCNLLCPNCHEAYYAIEIEPPTSKGSKAYTSNSEQWRNNQQGSRFGRSDESNNNNFQWAPFSGSSSTSSAFQAANMVKQAYEKVKRQRQKVQAATRRQEALHAKRQRAEFSEHINAVKRSKGVEDCAMSNETMKQVNCEGGIAHTANSSGLKLDKLKRCTGKDNGVCDTNIKQFLVEKAREELRRKSHENFSAMVTNATKTNENVKEHEKTDTNVAYGHQCNEDKFCERVETEGQVSLDKLNFGFSGPSRGIQVDQMSAIVPDPDFHGFDKGRTETCFRENQVWAVYDDDDGMPRHYAMIQAVISVNPFKVRVSWLHSITNSRVGHQSWFGGSFSKTCGEFRIGRLEICYSVDIFSHKVRPINSTAKNVEIFPLKGDVWALYRNWSAEWNELTQDEEIYKYDMVEVLEDYDEKVGVVIIPLVKVAGFRAVFHRHLNPREIRTIPKEEISRFSHQVPSHLLTGVEGPKYLKNCWELDAAAIPSEIIDVISQTEEIKLMSIDDEIELINIVDLP